MDLPAELWQRVFAYVPIKDLHACTRYTSHGFNDLVDTFLSSRATLQYIHLHWGILWTLGAPVHLHTQKGWLPKTLLGDTPYHPGPRGPADVLARGQQYLLEHRARDLMLTRTRFQSTRLPFWATLLNGSSQAGGLSESRSELWAASDDEGDLTASTREIVEESSARHDPLLVLVKFDLATAAQVGSRQEEDVSCQQARSLRHVHLFFSWSVQTCLSACAVYDLQKDCFWAEIQYRVILNAICRRPGRDRWFIRD